jgi:hypothetical protein
VASIVVALIGARPRGRHGARPTLAALVRADHGGVAGLGHELVVRTGRAYPPVLQVQDPAGEADRRQPVGDHDQRRLEVRSKALEDLRLDRRVDRARRVVQDQDARIPDERACERDPLALAARERVPAFTEDGVEAVRQVADEAVGSRDGGGAFDVVSRGAGIESDVLGDGVGEQEAFLEHDRRGAAERGRIDVTDVDAAEEDLARVGIVEPNDQLRERGLADPGRADDGDGLVRFDVERHLVEDAEAVEGVRHRLGADVERTVGKCERFRGKVDGHRLFEHLRDAAVTDDGARDLGQDPADESHRPREKTEQRDDLHERSERHVARRKAPRPDREQDDHREIRQRLQSFLERRADVTGADAFVAELLCLRAEPVHLRALAAERLHDERAVDRLVRDR